jgi:AcrR family transcriptional regulator
MRVNDTGAADMAGGAAAAQTSATAPAMTARRRPILDPDPTASSSIDTLVSAAYGTVRHVRERRIEVLPRRPHTSAREELRASQRGRLICAIADSVAVKGYAATSVADVLSLAGVSRRTFYEHFDDKEACFLAAYDAGAKAIFEAMADAIDPDQSWDQTLDAVFGTWLESLNADLRFTRAYMIEFWGAGDAARERWKLRRDRTAGLLRALHERARKEDPAIVPVSDTVVQAVVGGVNRVVIAHVLDDGEAPLTDLKPELLRFIKLALASHDDP